MDMKTASLFSREFTRMNTNLEDISPAATGLFVAIGFPPLRQAQGRDFR
jgi:hypothetical protein